LRRVAAARRSGGADASAAVAPAPVRGEGVEGRIVEVLVLVEVVRVVVEVGFVVEVEFRLRLVAPFVRRVAVQGG
jgi:hypothetical protein